MIPLSRHRAALELRLRASEPVRDRLEEIGGLEWLLGAVATERGHARIELCDGSAIIELDVLGGELVDATRTTADGEFARGTDVLTAALAMREGELVVDAPRPVRAKVAVPLMRIGAPPDGRDFARRINVVVAALTLAGGMIATVLGMGSPPIASAGDPNAIESRALAALPPLTWSNVADGSFTEAFEPYLADRFPLRGPLLGVDAAMRSARGFSPREEDVVMYSVASDAIDLGADPVADLDTDETDPVAAIVPIPVDTAPATDLAPDPEPEVEERPHGTTRVLAAGVLIRDGRAMQSFAGSPSGAPGYARLLNAIHAAVGDRATIYSAIIPTAQEFYLPSGSRNRVRDERPNILGTYARLDPGIRTVDIHAAIAPHVDENIYFRTDHHWTGLGAYYAYRAFCDAAHVEPVPIERMQRRVLRERWLGSLYRLTRDPTLEPDEVEIVVPPAHAVIRVPIRGTEREVPLFRDGSTGYDVFLGGDHPIMRARTTTRNGRRAILVKNSYGNAFAVFLVSHYEELVFVDYRTYRGSLRGLLEESDLPTDLIFMNGTLTANSRLHTSMIQRLLDGSG